MIRLERISKSFAVKGGIAGGDDPPARFHSFSALPASNKLFELAGTRSTLDVHNLDRF